MSGWALVDGLGTPLADARLPVTDPAVTVGWAVFETLRVDADGRAPVLAEHLERLRGSCDAALIPFPGADLLTAEVYRTAGRCGVPCRVRITLTGGGARLVVATPAEQGRRHRPVVAVRGAHRDDPFMPGWVKHTSRASWVVRVRRAGVDEVLLVDDAGRFTEGTTSGILAVVDGVLYTAPHDHRILASTTVSAHVQRAVELGIPVVREGPSADGPWDALYIASATRHLAPVAVLDGIELPVWDPIGRQLAGQQRPQ